MKIHSTLTGPIYHARAEEVYPLLPDAACSMAHVDGPYAMGKAAWDRQGISGLVEWYEPHVKQWSRILTPSASIYHWGNCGERRGSQSPLPALWVDVSRVDRLG